MLCIVVGFCNFCYMYAVSVHIHIFYYWIIIVICLLAKITLSRHPCTEIVQQCFFCICNGGDSYYIQHTKHTHTHTEDIHLMLSNSVQPFTTHECTCTGTLHHNVVLFFLARNVHAYIAFLKCFFILCYTTLRQSIAQCLIILSMHAHFCILKDGKADSHIKILREL